MKVSELIKQLQKIEDQNSEIEFIFMEDVVNLDNFDFEQLIEEGYSIKDLPYPNSFAIRIENIQNKYLKYQDALKSINQLTDEQRVDVFSKFCKHCGDTDPKCQCWNDK